MFGSGYHLAANTPLILRGVNFKFDSIKITQFSVALLQEAREIIAEHPKALISIDGHTDGNGGEAYNQNL